MSLCDPQKRHNRKNWYFWRERDRVVKCTEMVLRYLESAEETTGNTWKPAHPNTDPVACSLAGRAQTVFSKVKKVALASELWQIFVRRDSSSNQRGLPLGQKPPDLNEDVSPRVVDLNSWSQSLALFGEAVEPLRCRTLLERGFEGAALPHFLFEVKDSDPLPPAPLWTLPSEPKAKISIFLPKLLLIMAFLSKQ